MTLRSALAGAVLVLVTAAGLHGQAAGDTKEELAQEAANPIANLASLPLQLNNDFGLGEFDRRSVGCRAGPTRRLDSRPAGEQRLQVYWYAVKPDVGPDWQWRIQVQTLFPVGGG